MKMHTTITAMILALALPGSASLLDSRAKLEGAKQEAEAAAVADPANAELAAVVADKTQTLTTFDATQADKFGPDWLTRWQDSEYGNPDDEAADIYIGGKLFTGLPKLSTLKRQELLGHIAAKPLIVEEDTAAVEDIGAFHPAVEDRLDELAVHLTSAGIRGEEYFAFKHLEVLNKSDNGIGPRGFKHHMTTSEWFDLASANAHFSVDTFVAMRNHLLAHSARLLIDKRKAAGQSVEGPEFDAAIAPVVTALDAPKFDGLAEAVTSLVST